MAIGFPFSGQGRFGFASEPYGIVDNIIKEPVGVDHILRFLTKEEDTWILFTNESVVTTDQQLRLDS